MEPRNGRSVAPGQYLRYDGMPVEVLYLTRDIDTGADTVVCRDGDSRVYTTSLQSFLARTEWKGRFVTKYKPVSRQEPSQPLRDPRNASDYDTYARQLCQYFAENYRRYRLCVDQKQYFIPKGTLAAMKEDMNFLNNCLKTVLSPYNALFKGRFAEEMSIREYARLSGRNRGSIEYEQKKLFAALAQQLRLRDESEGKYRLTALQEET